MSHPVRSNTTFRAAVALLLTVSFAASSRAQSNQVPTGPDAPLWNVPNEGSYFNGPAIGPDGTIYIGTSEAGTSDALTTHGLYAVDRNGRIKWKYTTGKSIKSSPVIGPDGTIYIMVGIGTDTDAYGLDSSLHAVDPEGQKKWECPNLGSFGVGPVPDSPAIARDGTVYVSGAHDLFGLQNGCNIKWSYHFPDLDNVLGDGTRYHLSSLRSSPSVGDDGTVYVNTLEEVHSNVVGGIYAFSPSGHLRWHHPGSGCVPPAIGTDGTIYAGYGSYGPPGTPPKLVAINPDGTTKWELLTEHWIMAAPVIGTDGSIYVGTSQHPLNTPGVFFAVRADGTLKWKYDTAPDVADLPPAQANPPDIYPGASIDSNRVVYFADEVGGMWAIHEDGDLVWKRSFAPGIFDRWGNVMHGGFAIDDAGTLYYGSYDPEVGLVAMATGSIGLAASRWPKQAGNNQNTGRSLQYPRRVRHRIPRAG